MVGADGVIHGGEQGGVHAPAGVPGGVQQVVAFGALEDELHGAFAAQGVQSPGFVLVRFAAGFLVAIEVGAQGAGGGVEPEVPGMLGGLTGFHLELLGHGKPERERLRVLVVRPAGDAHAMLAIGEGEGRGAFHPRP